MLHQLPEIARKHLLTLMNKSWTTCDVPATWRRAEIIAIPKKGKDPADPGSYRPISLLSCTSKLFERLLQNRLQHWLEHGNKLNPNQAGFRKKHSTMDQITKITQSIFDALEERTHRESGRAVLALLDFQKAYDRVWKVGLLSKMSDLGIPAHINRWIKNFLADRRARVRWGNNHSDWKVLSEGLPQGSVLAPLLWLIYINDIDNQTTNDATWSLFADDVAILATGKTLDECATKLQPALDTVETWAKKWKVTASSSKCCYSTFTLNVRETDGKKLPHPAPTFQGSPLSHDKNPTFLGIKFDDQLTFKHHVESLKVKMSKRRQCLQAIAGKSYGAHQETLRIAYLAYIRSVFDYGAAAFFTHAAPAIRNKLETEQNKCARLITGCIRPTKTRALLAEANLPALTVRAKELAAMELSRAKRLPASDPTRQTLERTTTPRLKHRAHEAWIRRRENAEDDHPPEPPDEDTCLEHKPCIRRVGSWVLAEAGLADAPSEPFITAAETPPWLDNPGAVTINVDLPTETRKTDPPDRRRAAANQALAALPEPDCTIWSDGSAEEGTTNGGGGAQIILHREGKDITAMAAAGASCSSTRAELVAVRVALEAVRNLPPSSLGLIREIRLCTDSRACLQILNRGASAQTESLPAAIWSHLTALSADSKNITLQWVPGHAGITGNETADTIANQARHLTQAEIPLDLANAKVAIKRTIKKWTAARDAIHPNITPTPGHHNLSRWGQSTISQIRVGKSILTKDTLKECGLAEDSICPDCGEEDSIPHLLTECPAHATLRQAIWGGPLPTMQYILQNPAEQILEFLRRAGRSEPPLDRSPGAAATATAP